MALDAHNLGVTIGALMVPLIGLILLIVGIIERTRSRKQMPPMPPGYVASAKALKIGQCVADSDFANRDPSPTDCSNPGAVMELVSRGGANADCPDGRGRDDTDYATLFWDDVTMCFAANLQRGYCYAVNTTDPSESPFTLEPCSDPHSTVKIIQRLDGTTDAAKCAAGTKPVSYEQPARLYCLKAAK